MIADELAQVLDPAYLGDVSALSSEDLKARRTECQQVEAKLSYLRRLVQGRLDIAKAELERRAGGADAGDLGDLVERLSQILADRVRGPGPGRMPTNLVPPDDDELTSELDAVSGPEPLGSLPEMDDAALAGVADRLADLERQVSSQRKAVFGVLDALEGELTSRLGEAEVGGGTGSTTV